MLKEMRSLSSILALALALVLSLPGCSSDGGSSPDTPGVADLGGREGLLFPDVAHARDLRPADLPHSELGGGDGAADAHAADLPLPDMPLPDLLAPDLPPPQCSLYTHFTCSQPSSNQCTAACNTATATYQINCMWSFISFCFCVKNGNSVKTCTRVGTGCTPCQNAYSCCKDKF